jgi:transcriptional regulator with XRE-family HTH domain
METENFGTVLRAARERRQISLSEIARRTKVSTNSLQLLEAGKLDDLPPEVFVRGFIRSYAQAVGIPQNDPLTLYDEALNQKRRADDPGIPVLALQPRPVPAVPQAEAIGDDEGQMPRRGIGLAVFVIIVLLIATITLSLFLRQQPQSGEGLSLDVPARTTADRGPTAPV